MHVPRALRVCALIVVALAAWHLAVLRRFGRMHDALWAGLAVGVAAGTKYHGLIFVGVFALARQPGAGILAPCAVMPRLTSASRSKNVRTAQRGGLVTTYHS